MWSAVAVGRILSNPVYVGTLIQGKDTTPNYKVKKRVVKPENEWHVTENAHESIIKKMDFEIVSSLLSADTRTSATQEIVFPLSGMMFCGDCGNSIVRKKGGKYFYYVCATNKSGKGCTAHSFAAGELESAILEAISRQIAAVLDLERCLNYIADFPYQQLHIQKLNSQIADREAEIKDCERYKRSL